MTTAATYIAGVQNTGTILAAEKVIEVPNKLFWLRRSATPFLHLTGGLGQAGPKLKQKIVGNMEFHVFEKKPHAEYLSINHVGGYGAGDVTFVCDQVNSAKIGDLYKIVETGEIVHVTAKNNATPSITATRAFGTTAAAAFGDNATLFKIGTAFEDFGDYAQIVMVKNSDRLNYCQRFKGSWGLSDITADTVMYTGPKEPELSQEAMILMKLDVEKAFLMSEPYYSATGGPNGTPIWATGGAEYWIRNGGGVVEPAGPGYTRVQFNALLNRVFEENNESMTRYGLFGGNIMNAIEYWKDQKLEFRQSEEFFNLRVAEWETNQGRLVFMRDRILTNSPVGDTTQGYAGLGFFLDPDGFWQNQFNNHPIRAHLNIVRDGKTGTINEFRGIFGLGVSNPETSGLIEDFTTFS